MLVFGSVGLGMFWSPLPAKALLEGLRLRWRQASWDTSIQFTASIPLGFSI